MKAAIALDDWKLPVFRRRLKEAGFDYEDKGPLVGATTLLSVETEVSNLAKLQKVVEQSETECQRNRK